MQKLFITLLQILFLQAVFGHEPADGGSSHNNAGAGKVVTTVVRTGNGQHTYETVPGWGAMPDGQNLGPTHGGVAIDKSGNVYVSTEAAHAIAVFKKDGMFVKAIAPDCRAIHALAINEEQGTEYLYGAHAWGKRVVKLDLEGNIVLEIPHETTGEVPGGFKGITGVAVGPDGSIYASCGYGSNMVHKFDAKGVLLKSIGGKGKPQQEGKFHTCHGLTLDLRFDQPLLLVSDRENRRLVHLDLDLDWVGVHATNLRRPCVASILGDYCAVAELQGRVTIFDKNGTPVSFLGDNPNSEHWAKKPIPESQLIDGLFTSPHGLSYDVEGNLYVQDWNETGRVTKLQKVNF